MASGKKGKKTKGKTFALTDFLQETTGSIPVQPIRKSNLNWADEVEDFDDTRKAVNVVLPTAPKASRDYDDISNTVPMEPPFWAYLSNLPYDVDEDELSAFFKNMRIANMRIPKDDRGGESKSKGYGYIEFEDRESLLEALFLRDTTLKSRRMRIEVASNMDNDRRRGRMDMNRDRQQDRSDSFGDWRSGPRAPSDSMDNRRTGFNRDRDGGGGGGGFTREGMRDRDEKSFTREGMRDRDYGRDRDNRDFGRDRDSNRDFNRDRDSNRDSYRKDIDDRPGGWRDGDRQNKDDRDRDRGFNRDRGNFRDSDRGSRYDDDRRGGGFGGRRFDDRRDDKDRDRRDGFSRRDDRDTESSEPRERPKLMLAPRTKPVEVVPVNTTESVPSASIFGSAKPVDTAQREREIEEKIAREADKPRESSKDRDENRKHENSERKNVDRIERSKPPPRRIDDSPSRDKDHRDGPRKNYDDRKLPPKNDQKSPDRPDNRHKYDKSEKPKREEKRDRYEKDMPKLTEPEPPNFAANNKFAFLPTDSD
ncbi:unnamed protein product [Diabrotica balteata]|uniref:RRM domain-containing protein n=1 Tax=Diabrotica balteata TaxID=107213 RepID=A0A9P0E584_DIABA|nr:unnamed protein product [Diabrotica balteata]